MQMNRRAKTRATSTIAAFAVAAVAVAAVTYALSRRRTTQHEREEEETSAESKAAAENSRTPAKPAPTIPRDDEPDYSIEDDGYSDLRCRNAPAAEAQTPEWLRIACSALAGHAGPGPARAAVQSARLSDSHAPLEGLGASYGGDAFAGDVPNNLPPSLREEPVLGDRGGAPVEEGARHGGRKLRLPTGAVLTATALVGVMLAWAATLLFDWGQLGRSLQAGWFVGNMVCE